MNDCKTKFISFIIVVVLVTIMGCRKEQFDTKNLGITWVKVPSGKFIMGTPPDAQDYDKDELPLHQVYLDTYFISAYEITCGQYFIFCEETGHPRPNELYPEDSKDNLPITYVSWHDAIAFCKWLSKKTNQSITLPTEAQWEKACRAGTLGDTYLYKAIDPTVKEFEEEGIDPPEMLKKHAWFRWNSEGHIHPVGKLMPNGFGLYDMLGNVNEWCLDFYVENYYSKSPIKNPINKLYTDEYKSRVVRGGSFFIEFQYIRCAKREPYAPLLKVTDTGFRIVKNIKK